MTVIGAFQTCGFPRVSVFASMLTTCVPVCVVAGYLGSAMEDHGALLSNSS